jgi:hypothetical protein
MQRENWCGLQDDDYGANVLKALLKRKNATDHDPTGSYQRGAPICQVQTGN